PYWPVVAAWAIASERTAAGAAPAEVVMPCAPGSQAGKSCPATASISSRQAVTVAPGLQDLSVRTGMIAGASGEATAGSTSLGSAQLIHTTRSNGRFKAEKANSSPYVERS